MCSNTQSPLSVGDRVRAVPGPFTNGEEGVITDISGDYQGHPHVEIREDDGRISGDFHLDELELVA